MHGRDDEEANYAKTARKKPHPDHEEFRNQNKKRASGMKRVRKLLYIPADPGREWSILIVLIHGREIAPRRIAAKIFGDAGFEIDREPNKEQEKKARARRWR